MTPSTEKAKRQAHRAAVQTKRWVRHVARVGYFALGVVYVLVAVLAALGVMGLQGGQFTGSGGAARTLLSQPYGRPMLTVVAVGLTVFVGWRFLQALFDVEGRGRDLPGLMARTGLALSGLSYSGLAVLTIHYLVTGTGRVQDPKDELTAQLMTYPGGKVAAGIIGILIIGVGLFQFYSAYRAGFFDYMDTDDMPRGTRITVSGFGRFALACRGVVFCIIGWFVAQSAFTAGADELLGIGGVLRLMGRQPHGYWLIAIVASGLFAYGLYMLSKTRYRFIVPPEVRSDESPSVASPSPPDA